MIDAYSRKKQSSRRFTKSFGARLCPDWIDTISTLAKGNAQSGTPRNDDTTRNDDTSCIRHAREQTTNRNGSSFVNRVCATAVDSIVSQ